MLKGLRNFEWIVCYISYINGKRWSEMDVEWEEEGGEADNWVDTSYIKHMLLALFSPFDSSEVQYCFTFFLFFFLFTVNIQFILFSFSINNVFLF